jgi:outer membrane immunogenic protein
MPLSSRIRHITSRVGQVLPCKYKDIQMRFLAASALLLAATATPAFAQEEAAAPTPFTGAHAEAVVGWDHVGALGDGESGVVYGGAVGYDAQFQHVVVGAEGEVTGSTVEESGVHAGRDFYAGGRIGFVVGDSTLIYAKGGYTNARVTFSGTGANFDGWRVGGGVEHDFGRFFGKVEYRYSRYEDADLNRDQVVAGLGVRF